MENNLERRYLNTEIRNIEDRTIQGTAIVFNSESRDMGFIETISPDAISQDVIDTQDVVMLYNHDENQGILARRNRGKGTLGISINERGVDFNFKARKGSPLAEEVLSAVNAGDLSACSFAFRVSEGGDTWENRDGQYYRTINKIDVLRDLSIVSNPAYEETSCRSFEKFKEELEKRDTIVNVVVEVIEEPVSGDTVQSDSAEPKMSGDTMMEDDGCKTKKPEERDEVVVVEPVVETISDEELKSYYDDIDKLIKEINL